jgi:hypothetical protein
VDIGPAVKFPALLKPGMHLTKEQRRKIQRIENEELHSAKFLPAEYKPVDIIKVVHKQTHLTAGE